jgi:uncharacterized protein
MNNPIKLSFISDLKKSISANSGLIQVVLGPRQVGKTTGILSLIEDNPKINFKYVNADGDILKHKSWLEEIWINFKSENSRGILVIDEIQKVENWSEIIKKLWDQQKKDKTKIGLILLGSSSLSIQKGLSESLTGRFFLHRVYQWNFEESKEGYKLKFNEFLKYGGYPGSYQFVDKPIEFMNYVKNSIIDTVIGKDILQIARVKSPALFRQAFDIACGYGGQEISYTKLLGQLQDKGNVELVKHYLELFEGAFLLKQLYKYSPKMVLKKSSSPKILPMCPVLYTLSLNIDLNQENTNRTFEITIGYELARLPGHLYYWREGNYEVDYIYQFGKKIYAIEVKTNLTKSTKGLTKFLEKNQSAKSYIMTPDNYQSIIAEISNL